MSLPENLTKNYKSGFIALIGRPNVGKSTLLNKLVGEKVSITSPVAQTTRNKLRAILTTDLAQVIFIDTPGIHKPHHLLGEQLVKSARSVLGEVDAVLLMFEANEIPGKGDAFIVNLLRNQNKPVLVALNKWDLVQKDKRPLVFEQYQGILKNSDWHLSTCSAANGEGCDQLINQLINNLPIGPLLYPPEMICDQPEIFILGELIREQVLFHTREEIPHSVAVNIDKLEEIAIKNTRSNKKFRTCILATIIVERKSQKGILIGKAGSMLKKIGQGARCQMQNLIQGSVYLELFVKVVPDWRSKPGKLSELGYMNEK